jgi:hypothetical protein
MTDVTSYSYDSAKQELVSYDTPNIVRAKAQYAVKRGLGGSMFWELSTDKKGSDSLVGVSRSVFGTLDQSANHISFPDSKFDNLRKNFGGVNPPQSTTTKPTTTATPTSTKPTTTPSPTTTKTTTTPSPTTTSGGGSCSGVGAWSSGVAYTGGMKVTYSGRLWTAKWWTQAETRELPLLCLCLLVLRHHLVQLAVLRVCGPTAALAETRSRLHDTYSLLFAFHSRRRKAERYLLYDHCRCTQGLHMYLIRIRIQLYFSVPCSAFTCHKKDKRLRHTRLASSFHLLFPAHFKLLSFLLLVAVAILYRRKLTARLVLK